ncbi:DUF2313 domain-containing protein [Salmonella enterica]|nr:DUF2313 domain-containing protein [Salmonella enterica]EAX3609049.1 DUF2313 domain-containing protein [Salmonella enterica]EGW6282587.1 DUF2313 domain-containing protein [Salmonella enterica]EGX3933150.1 DUF2313 domain-containing protein [Salmonella enterica]
MSGKFSREQYRDALSSLMPRGQAWSEAPGTVQQGVLSALAASCERSDSAAVAMLKASFPATATDFLTEWEKSLGLPDECGISETGVGARQQAILAKMAFSGGQSRAFYIALAKSMGYDISINVFRQARAGLSRCGDALNGDDWPASQEINIPAMSYLQAHCQISYCGDPLRSWGNRRLACTISRQAQSHTAVLFNCRGGIVLTAGTEEGQVVLHGRLVYPDSDISTTGATVEILFTDPGNGNFRKKTAITDENSEFSIRIDMAGTVKIRARARFTQQSYGALMISSDVLVVTTEKA